MNSDKKEHYGDSDIQVLREGLEAVRKRPGIVHRKYE